MALWHNWCCGWKSSEFSWEATARLTLEAYKEAAGSQPRVRAFRHSSQEIAQAIHRTPGYAAVFDYPLKTAEVYDRLGKGAGRGDSVSIR